MLILTLFLISRTLAVPSNVAQFQDLLTANHLSYPGAELKLRLSLFQRHLHEVDLHNADPRRSWEAGVNGFSVMSPAERSQHLGLGNLTDVGDLPESALVSLVAAPSSIDHTTLGHVTVVKNQGECGSCWAFGAVASFEGSYSILTKTLRMFSEQELLDCTYPDTRDGCRGGWYHEAWGYIQQTGRLGLMEDIPYQGTDGACNYSNQPNGIVDVKYTGYQRVTNGDSNLVTATSQYVPAVAIRVESDLYSYKKGWYDGCPDGGAPNHAVTMVGYDPGYWKVKNSWGDGWGDSGYILMARERPNICRISDYVMYPKLAQPDWSKLTLPHSGHISKPAGATKLRLKVKCQANGIHERIKVFTYNNGQTGHVELITSGSNDSQFSLFCSLAGNRRWHNGARYFGKHFSNSQRGSCDSQGFREYEYQQFDNRYQVSVGSFSESHSSVNRGRCSVKFNKISVEVADATDAYYKWL